ncbi:tRNA pseudouridine(55) synthase TruB [Natronospira bacteriovora]|uniref:tRNA pseudouridine synthase B n=1 Tax=Natronospira bacteriovora TaxID=3069753 RepID=A0ABU0W547_9GAMM|nr:tRNA pseudouridine(55) synthase TruB [Natronospira sp. AB-CW4]MDQ2069147.1 tRNA pseudouridine(55) synthase TruB [Natronospira sp. AB-CW4]
MPRRRRGRDIHGILPLDKPLGASSNAVLQRVRRLLDARKAGHTGSLDPLASGVLPLCFGEATKVSALLLDADKTYRFTCQLGSRTATGDVEGGVVETAPVPDLSEDAVRQAMQAFLGDIEQIPPMYSALKQDGKRLYEIARAGGEVARHPRPVHIRRFELLAHRGDALDLEVSCSKGTYVRVLAEDLARALGSVGHVTALRRIAAGPYREHELLTLEQIEAASREGDDALRALLLPVDSALPDWESVTLDPDLTHYFKQGQAVTVSDLPAAERIRVYGEGSGFLGLGRRLPDGRLAPRRLILCN